VTIIDKDEKLGGMVNLAHLPPHKEELKNILDYYNRQMNILNVDIKTNTTLSPEVIEDIKPEAVVLATGATEIIPNIPGIDAGHVVTASDILTGDKSAGENVVVIGGGLIGVETAEFIADQDKKVTVVEMLRSVAADLGATSRWGTLSRIKKKVNIFVLTTVIEVKENAVVVKDQDDKTIEIPADTVVIAAGMKSRAEITIDDTDLEVIKIGSCKNPGLIAEAVADGFEAGCKI
jgi:pyruvate/2-oxoglutarate dehydrogenase complex dihydrolipoamide dehydrogenase (E3) component